jgi:hypothetical protein
MASPSGVKVPVRGRVGGDEILGCCPGSVAGSVSGGPGGVARSDIVTHNGHGLG